MSAIQNRSFVALCLLALLLPSLCHAGSGLRQEHLDNGLEILMQEAHGGPMVASIVTVGAGARFEDATSFGSSHFLEHMTFNGTQHFTREDINEGIKGYGGYINAFTRGEYTSFVLLIPKAYLKEGLEIQAAMLFDSTLPQHEFDKEKLVVLEEMNKDTDSGSYRGQLYRNGVIMENTPYAHPILGTVDTITGLTRDQVYGYYKERYQPANCRLFLVGDFKRRAAMKLLDEVFGGYESKPVTPPPSVALSWPSATDYRLYRAEEGKPSLELYWPAPPIGDGDYAAQLVLASLLNDEHRSPLVQGEGGTIDLGLHIELYEDFSVFTLSVDPGEMEPEVLLPLLAERLHALGSWVVGHQLAEEAAHALRVEEVFLKDTYHYYAMMKSAELSLGGYPFLAEYEKDLKTMDTARVRKALESSLLASPPRIIWSAQEGGLEALPDDLAQAFRTDLEQPTLVATHKAKGAKSDKRKPAKIKRTSKRKEKRLVLKNGLTILLRSDPSSEVFASHLLIRGRSAKEPLGKAGMVTLAHQLLASGTSQRSGAEIDAALSAMVAKLKTNDNPWIPFDNYYTREDFSFIRFETLDESAAEGLALLGELLADASYPDAEVEKTKGRMIGGLSMGSPRPMEIARQNLAKHLFGGGTRGEPIGGTAASIATIDAAALREFHTELFDPADMILSIVSSRTLGDLQKMVKSSFGGLQRGNAPLPSAALAATGPHSGVHPMEKAQVAILGTRLLPPKGETDPQLPVLVRILSSRMALELREKQGLAYSLGAGLRFTPGLGEADPGFGQLSVQISTGAENRERAKAGIEMEIERMVNSPPTEEEIFRAVNGAWGRELMRHLSRIHQAYSMGLAEHLGEDPFADSEERAALQRECRPEELAALAEKNLLTGSWIWTEAGGGLE